MPEHISKQFDQELEAVRARVLQMGGLVEEQIINAMESLASGNVELANTVMANDHRVNALEVALDEECSMIIARRQPTARDLRMLLTVIKTITDLERIGDEASKVARMAKLIYETDRLVAPRFTEIKHMTSIVLDMLRKALDGFARLEASNATQIARLDESVDEEYRMVLRHLVTYMMEDPRSISMFIEIIFAAKAIERMGDHAKNMSEYVVYMVKGKDVRHTSVEEIEKEVSR